MPPFGQTFDIAMDDHSNIRSYRKGFYISKMKAIIIAILLIACLVAVGLATYYVTTGKIVIKSDKTIENKIESSVDSIKAQQISDKHQRITGLPDNVIPLHYRLRIDPTFNGNCNSNSTFSGEVIITLFINGSNTRKIELHTSSLIINRKDIQVAKQEKQSKPILKSMSLIQRNPRFKDGNPQTTSEATSSTTTESNLKKMTSNTSPTTTTPISTVGLTTSANSVTTGAAIVESTTSKTEAINNKLDTFTEPVKSTVMSTTQSSVQTVNTTESLTRTTENNQSISISNVNDTDDQINVVTHLIQVKKFEFQPEFGKLILHLEDNLENGHNYTVRITYTGHLRETYQGFYCVKNKNTDDVSYYAATQLEPTFARKAFPCLDEPSFKAKFTISISHKEDMVSLSNAPLKETEPRTGKTGYVWSHFKTTKPMATHNVAFVIGNFINRKTTSSSGIDINVWGRSNIMSKDTLYVESIAPKILDYYQQFFNINYPLPKLDLIGIDSIKSTTNSWGLIGLREEYFFENSTSISESMKQQVFLLLSQQIVDQWFENLISNNWWSNLWLRESLASYLSIFAANQLEPQWNINETFIINNVQSSLAINQVKSNQPLASIVLDPIQIVEYSESSVQQKGTALIRMLNFTLTEPILIDGIKQFLTQKSDQIYTENDLWQALINSSKNSNESMLNVTNMDLKQIVDNWIHKPGVPLVIVKRNNQTNDLKIVQQRYPQNDNSENTKWDIPLFYLSKTDMEENPSKLLNSFWLDQKQTSIEIPIENLTNSDWVLFNPSQIGGFRVNYDSNNWQLLTQSWANSSNYFVPSIKSQLLDDILNNAFHGLTDYDVALNMTLLLTNETTNKSPWLSWINAIENINILMSDTASYDLLQDYVLNITRPLYLNSSINQDLEDLIRNIACRYELDECVEWAQQKFSKLQKKSQINATNSMSENKKYTIYCTAVSVGSKKEWDYLWKRMQSISDILEYRTILTSLSCSKSKWILKRYLSYIFLENRIKLSWIVPVLTNFNSRLANDVLFEFTQEHFGEIHNKTKINAIVHNNVLKTIFERLNTVEQLHKLLELYEKHETKLKSYAVLIKDAIEYLKIKISWSRTNLPKVEKWLRKRFNKKY